jgi:hypothetical protein
MGQSVAIHIDPAAQHVELAHLQRGHFAPPQAGVGQEAQHLTVKISLIAAALIYACVGSATVSGSSLGGRGGCGFRK